MITIDYPSTCFECFSSALRCRRTGIELGHIETEEVDVTDDQQPQQRRVVRWTCGEMTPEWELETTNIHEPCLDWEARGIYSVYELLYANICIYTYIMMIYDSIIYSELFI